MPFIRCWHYDEHGSAIRDGCPTGSCSFVHPGDADWDRAPANNRRRPSGKGTENGQRNSSISWGKPPPVPPSKSASWDTGGAWRTSGDRTGRKTDGGWNTKSRGTTSEKAEWGSSSTSAWGIGDDASSERASGSTWSSSKSSQKDSSTSGGWGSAGQGERLDDDKIAELWNLGSSSNNASGWGTSSSSQDPASTKDSNASEGWGNWGKEDRRDADIVGSWDKKSTTNNSNDWANSSGSRPSEVKKSSNPSNGWGVSSSSSTGWGNAGDSDTSAWGSWDIADTSQNTRDASNKKPRPSTSNQVESGGGWGSVSNEVGSDRGWGGSSNEVGSSRGWGSVSTSKASLQEKPRENELVGWKADNDSRAEPARPPSIPTKATGASAISDALKSSSTTNMDSKSHSNSKFITGRKRTSGKQSTSKRFLRRTRGPKARALLYTCIIKQTLNLVRLQVDYQRAVGDTDRWRSTRNSKVYSRATFATRNKLDYTMEIYSRKRSAASGRRDYALKALLALPDMEKPPTHRNPAFDKERIMSYTAELRNWITDLQLHRRISSHVSNEIRNESETQGDEHSIVHPSAGTAVPQEVTITGTELKSRGTWNWTEIREAIAALEAKIQGASEEIYTKSFTRFSEVEDVQQQVGTLASKAVEEVKKKKRTAITDEDRAGRIATLKTKASSIGDAVGLQANRAAELLTQIHARDEELGRIRAVDEASENFCEELEEKMIDLDKLQKEDEKEIEELRSQIQNLHIHKRKPRAGQQLKMENIMLHLQSMVAAQLEREVVPIFEMFRKQCESHNLRLEEDVSKRLEPILRMTDAILHKAQNEAVTAEQHT